MYMHRKHPIVPLLVLQSILLTHLYKPLFSMFCFPLPLVNSLISKPQFQVFLKGRIPLSMQPSCTSPISINHSAKHGTANYTANYDVIVIRGISNSSWTQQRVNQMPSACVSQCHKMYKNTN